MNRILYLHGFASSPLSKKASYFRRRFNEAGIPIEVLDLTDNDFNHLTISSQLRIIERVANSEPVLLIGSSLGGYLAALYAARHAEVTRMMMMAPAFNFIERWRERIGPDDMMRWKETGWMGVEHYGDGQVHQLHYGLIEDGSEYEAYPKFPQPAIIFHGRNDDVVPPEYSITFAQQHENVELHLVDSDHELLNVLEPMSEETARFFGLVLNS